MSGKTDKKLRRAVRQQLAGNLPDAFVRIVKPRPKFMPHWLWVWLLKLLLRMK